MSKIIQDYIVPTVVQAGQQRDKETITAFAWSSDGTLLASCTSYGDIQIWNTKTHKVQNVFPSACTPQPCLTWSPNNLCIAVHTNDEQRSIKFWDVEKGIEQEPITRLTRWLTCLAWSPDGKFLAGGSSDGLIRIWNAQTRQHVRTLNGHSKKVSCLLWLPDGERLVSGSSDKLLHVWYTRNWRIARTLNGHFDEVSCLAWIEPQQLVASGSVDRTIRIWDIETGRQRCQLEAHTAAITSLSVLNGDLLASKAETVRIWSIKTWESLESKDVSSGTTPQSALAFAPRAPVLALAHDNDTAIWMLDVQDIQHRAHLVQKGESMVHYTNAKVVLLGESGVGKSGLTLVLLDQQFQPTPSSHGHNIFSFEKANPEHVIKDGIQLETDTLLWDLAGQASYRLMHQFHLKDVAVALILFDYHNDTNPFAGIDYWDRSLRLAKKAQDTSSVPCKEILVAARVDVGGRRVNLESIKDFCRERGFEAFYETSAIEGTGIEELIKAIKASIDWNALPHLASLHLFQSIKEFLLAERKRGRILATANELEASYRASVRDEQYTSENLSVQFETCINLVESSGLIHRLRMNNYVLLRPELIDAYAAALANSLSNDPDGTGVISEQDVRAGKFDRPKTLHIEDSEQEQQLIFAMIEDLIRNEIVLRDQGDLIFPSQSTKEHPQMPDLSEKMKTVTFTFEGPVANIYAVLAVRISRSGIFLQPTWWKNAVVYKTIIGGMCGISLDNYGEGRAKLTLFFDRYVSTETRTLFEGFVEKCLKDKTLTMKRERIFLCEQCGAIVAASDVKTRRENGYDWIYCNICSNDNKLIKISLKDTIEFPDKGVEEMNRAADAERVKEVDRTSLEQKHELKQFDVFISYNRNDKAEVVKIAAQLREKGILPFLDEWEIRPGDPWQREVESQIRVVKSAAIFVGKAGMGSWHRFEMETFLQQYRDRDCRVIPVILSDAPEEIDIPFFLRSIHHVDFRKLEPEPLEQLIWGITGEKGW